MDAHYAGDASDRDAASRAMQLSTVVVGFDGSEESRDALRLAETVRAAYDAELVVALVDELDPLVEVNFVELETREKYYAQIFDQAAEQLTRDDFHRRTSLGSAPRGLDWIATDTEADHYIRGGIEEWQRIERFFREVERENQLILRAAGYEPAEVEQELGLTSRQYRKRIEKAKRRLADPS